MLRSEHHLTSPILSPMILPDRRRHRRLALTLFGRFMRANKQEFPCKLIDISVGGLSLNSPVTVDLGEKVVAYIDQVGGLEGTVARVFAGGFALKITASRNKREQLAATLTWLINRLELDPADGRRHERISITAQAIKLTMPDESVLEAKIIDVSISGASIATDLRPDIGTRVVLGKLRSRVARHHATGIGLSFVDIQNPAALRRYFG